MSATVYYDKDADMGLLRGRTVAIIGYGSQGHAHALNLKDSGFNVIVGLYEGSRSKKIAEEAGLEVVSNAEATKRADLISFCLPDTVQKKVYNEDVKPNLTAGKTLLFAHGFTIFYDQINPTDNVDVVMIAPKAPGHRVRAVFERGLGVPCLIAVHQDVSGTAHDLALAYGKGIGGGRAGILETTFKEETETDLFGEQAVLCGGVTEMVVAGFETLVEAGYQPEVAYYEVMHELKLIVDLLHEGGLKKMHKFISDTAAWGDMTSGPLVIDATSRAAMKDILSNIQDGTFARNWIAESEAGMPNFKSKMQADLDHPIEKVGADLRARMDWLND